MRRVSNGVADEDYCEKLRKEAPISARYLEEHGVKFVHHDEPNVLLEFNTDQHFVFPEGGGHAIINTLFDNIRKYKDCDVGSSFGKRPYGSRANAFCRSIGRQKRRNF